MDLDEFMARSNARARRGRRTARVLFGVGIYIVLLFVVLFVAAPNTMGGPMMRPSGFAAAMGIIVPGAGLFGQLFGLAWMWRILRADPEPDSRSWRYRR